MNTILELKPAAVAFQIQFVFFRIQDKTTAITVTAKTTEH